MESKVPDIFAYVQDDLILRILHVFKDPFSLDTAQLY